MYVYTHDTLCTAVVHTNRGAIHKCDDSENTRIWVKYTYIRTYCTDCLILDRETQYGHTYLHWQSRVHWEKIDL